MYFKCITISRGQRHCVGASKCILYISLSKIIKHISEILGQFLRIASPFLLDSSLVITRCCFILPWISCNKRTSNDFVKTCATHVVTSDSPACVIETKRSVCYAIVLSEVLLGIRTWVVRQLLKC